MTHAAVDKDYVPYTKRLVLRSNAGLFVSAIGRGGAGAQVALQAGGCVGKSDGTPCGSFPGMTCCDGQCIFGSC
jgi:hypothetical protein